MKTLDGGEWSNSRFGRFTPDKEPWYPLNRILGGPQSQSAGFEEGKNLFFLPGFEPRIAQY
jgi:hypothetical protein